MSTRTLVLCKPDAVERGLVGEIVGRLERKGLTIVALELRQIDEELAGRHYEEHRDKPFFGDLVAFITRSPLVAMVIEGGPDTWQVVRLLMGTTNPREAAPGHDPRRPRARDGREPRARIRRCRVSRSRDRLVLPASLGGMPRFHRVALEDSR